MRSFNLEQPRVRDLTFDDKHFAVIFECGPRLLKKAISMNEHGAAQHFERDGKHPDSILRCTLQSGDGSNADFLDCAIGLYRNDRVLRILMQNDEPDDPSDYWLCCGDVPWSELLQVILRTRTTPTVQMDIPQPDGTYGFKGPYLQTRLYMAGVGSVYRFLGRDDPGSAAPFEWLKANIDDPEIRFTEDTQENALFGDNTYKVVSDSLTEYAMAIKMRSERADDAEFSKRALSLPDHELAALRAAAPKEFSRRNFNPLKDSGLNDAPKDFASFIDEFDRWYVELVGEGAETVSPALRTYAKTVVERLALGAIRSRYFGIFFYGHFPPEPQSDGATKAKLLQVVRWMRPGGNGRLV